MQNTTETVHRKGEINILGDRNLETIEISSFFPAQEYPFCQYKGFDTNPINYINKIKKWEYEKVTPTFVMTGDVDFNKTVSIESLEYGKDDSTGDNNLVTEDEQPVVGFPGAGKRNCGI